MGVDFTVEVGTSEEEDFTEVGEADFTGVVDMADMVAMEGHTEASVEREPSEVPVELVALTEVVVQGEALEVIPSLHLLARGNLADKPDRVNQPKAKFRNSSA